MHNKKRWASTIFGGLWTFSELVITVIELPTRLDAVARFFNCLPAGGHVISPDWFQHPPWFLSPYVTIPTGIVWIAFTWRRQVARALLWDWFAILASLVQVPLAVDFRQHLSDQDPDDEGLARVLGPERLRARTFYFLATNKNWFWPLPALQIHIETVSAPGPLQRALPIPLKDRDTGRFRVWLNPGQTAKFQIVGFEKHGQVFVRDFNGDQVFLASDLLGPKSLNELAYIQANGALVECSARQLPWFSKTVRFRIDYDQNGVPSLRLKRSRR